MIGRQGDGVVWLDDVVLEEECYDDDDGDVKDDIPVVTYPLFYI